MQKGEFLDEKGIHPIGKCIFVFTSRISNTFEEFYPNLLNNLNDKYKQRKACDFVRCLNGKIDIKGPNRWQTEETEDKNYLLRRAMLIKSMIKDKKIDEEIIENLLWLPEYKFGAYSMKFIIDTFITYGKNIALSKIALSPNFPEFSFYFDPHISKRDKHFRSFIDIISLLNETGFIITEKNKAKLNLE